MSYLAGHELREFNTATMTANYQKLGAPLLNAAYYAYITNHSLAGAFLSLDGITNDMRIEGGATLVLVDYSKHTDTLESSYIFKKGQQLFIKEATGAGVGILILNILTRS